MIMIGISIYNIYIYLYYISDGSFVKSVEVIVTYVKVPTR